MREGKKEISSMLKSDEKADVKEMVKVIVEGFEEEKDKKGEMGV